MMRYSLSWVSPKKMTPLGVAAPRGFLCLLALAVTIKPLAQIVCRYLRCDSHEKVD